MLNRQFRKKMRNWGENVQWYGRRKRTAGGRKSKLQTACTLPANNYIRYEQENNNEALVQELQQTSRWSNSRTTKSWETIAKNIMRSEKNKKIRKLDALATYAKNAHWFVDSYKLQILGLTLSSPAGRNMQVLASAEKQGKNHFKTCHCRRKEDVEKVLFLLNKFCGSNQLYKMVQEKLTMNSFSLHRTVKLVRVSVSQLNMPHASLSIYCAMHAYSVAHIITTAPADSTNDDSHSQLLQFFVHIVYHLFLWSVILSWTRTRALSLPKVSQTCLL